jgi:hypothetical protein
MSHQPGAGGVAVVGAAAARVTGAAGLAAGVTDAACASRFSPSASMARPRVSTTVTTAKWRYMLGGMAGVTARRIGFRLTAGS